MWWLYPSTHSMPGTLVLIRHGASEFNLKKIFTGWIDAPLAEQGKKEAHQAATELIDYEFDLAFTSLLSRAQDTLDILLGDLDQREIPTEKNEALNERHYGDLQGHNKDDMREKFGEEQVHLWRRSFDIAPPNGESLKDTCARTIPYFEDHILPKLKEGKNVIIAAHGNSLRSIVKDLDQLDENEIVKLEIPTGVPIVYNFDDTMKVSKKEILHYNLEEEKKESHKVQ